MVHTLAELLAAAPLAALDGPPLTERDLVGRTVLFVNVASRCGLTPQYAGLVKLVEEVRDDEGFRCVGVPCNQFGAQEPGSAAEIRTFCSTTYGVDFPLLAKQDVNGPDRSPLYRWLVGDGPDIEWNFAKFVVGREGRVLQRFAPTVRPEDPALREVILADRR
ncbi:MAG: glutathione peroxidase [Nannocystaceae bacterium]